MRNRRWINQSQPQTLQGAVLFCYLNAALALLYWLLTRELLREQGKVTPESPFTMTVEDFQVAL